MRRHAPRGTVWYGVWYDVCVWGLIWSPRRRREARDGTRHVAWCVAGWHSRDPGTVVAQRDQGGGVRSAAQQDGGMGWHVATRGGLTRGALVCAACHMPRGRSVVRAEFDVQPCKKVA